MERVILELWQENKSLPMLNKEQIVYNAKVLLPNINSNIKFLLSNFCDYNNACILVTDDITIAGNTAARVAIKIYWPFAKFSAKIDWKNRWCWRLRYSYVYV